MDLESGTSYELRVTAYNNAGSTQAEYLFSTLSSNGNNRLHEDHPQENETTPLYLDAHVLAPSVISVLAVMLAIAGVCFCLKTREYEPIDLRSNQFTSQTYASSEGRIQIPAMEFGSPLKKKKKKSLGYRLFSCISLGTHCNDSAANWNREVVGMVSMF